MVWDDLTPQQVLTRGAFLNAAAVQMALGGSTNAAVHLIAMARRAGVEFALDDLDAMGRRVPVIANLFPSGDRLMEDFHYAGGVPALMTRLVAHLSLGERNVNGKTLGQNLEGVRVLDDEVIRPLERPVSANGALAVLRGNLAPDGAVMKASAASPKFLQHRGRVEEGTAREDLWRRQVGPHHLHDALAAGGGHARVAGVHCRNRGRAGQRQAK